MSVFPSAPSPDTIRAALRALVGGLDVGATLAGWTLVHLDVDEAIAYVFERGGHRVEITLGPRTQEHPHFRQSASLNLSYYIARLPGRALPDDGMRLVDEVVARITTHDDGTLGERMRGRGSAAHGGPGAIQLTRVESMLCPVNIDGAAYYTANPYLGCLIGCSFCYAQPRVQMVRRLIGLEDREWGSFVLAKENAAEVLERELETLEPRPVVLSPLVADVYQSVERKLELTRRCLAALARHQRRTYVLTRAALVVRDIDLFRQIPGCTVGFSVSTDGDRVGRAFEPRAALISERLDALAKLRQAGVRTVAVVQPILPMNPGRLAGLLAGVCDAVRVDDYLPADVGGTPLRAHTPDGPPPPTREEERALHATLVAELTARGVPLWTSHVPP